MSVESRVELPVDDVGAFVGAPAVLAAGAPEGPLAGRRLAVKDLIDVAGVVTGAGNPTFAAGRAPAAAHAPAVSRLVDAGATVVGKTVTDELAYSLSGTNVHYGTPRNVAAPGRVPGGSSAGSAAAAAAGLVDLALGSDTGGSIRVPASYCGLYGWRPTHGAVPIAGVVPLAPSFDTVGLFAPTADLLLRGAAVLLGADVTSADEGAPPTSARPVQPMRPVHPVRPVLLAEALADVADPVASAVAGAAARLGAPAEPLALGLDLGAARTAFRDRQGWEAWAAHGQWIEAVRPPMGRGITARFAAASGISEADVAAADAVRAQVAGAVRAATADGTVLVMPAAPGPAPPIEVDPATHESNRTRVVRLTAVAGLAGAPVVVVPGLTIDGLPLGLAFVGAPGSDLDLLAFAAAHWRPTDPVRSRATRRADGNPTLALR